MTSRVQYARDFVRLHKGILRTRELLAAGIHPRTICMLRDCGELEQLARGLYRPTSLASSEYTDLATVAKRSPDAIVCLISALAYHGLTTQIPHAVHIALPRSARTPVTPFPPVEVYRFSERTRVAGVETHTIDGVRVRIYSAEKTLADCFKFRNTVGVDIALEGLKHYFHDGRRVDVQKVLWFARLCRVERIMRPYLEASV